MREDRGHFEETAIILNRANSTQTHHVSWQNKIQYAPMSSQT